tara:strand:- start:2556 stop:3296 length:741 start_codon:yes stop_codon:yes gene_type:complete
MLGISSIVHIVSQGIVEKIQEHFSENDIILNDLKINIPGKSINNSNEFTVDKWIIQHSQFNHYDHSNSGLVGGKYTVYVYFDFYNLKLDAIVHEVKHAYVDWCIFKNKGRSIKETKEAKELYTKDFSRLISQEIHLFPNLQHILSLYYHSTKLEIPSFLENHFLDDSYINYKTIAIDMININIEKYKNKDSEKEYKLLKSYNIPALNRYNDYEVFLKKTEKFFKKRGFYILKRVNRLEVLKKNKNI